MRILQNMTFGNRVKSSRVSKGMTQEVLCRKASISKGFLSDVENGKRSVSAETLLSLSKVFGVTMDELFIGKNRK